MLNTVPFDKLGPGQSGRLAYQVLGQDGPIMNPQNIRYLPPDSAELPANAMNTGATGLAGANLICSFLNLGVSAFIASQVVGLHRKMDRLQETMDRIERKVDYIVSKVDRIDIQVAENNLRPTLDHVLSQAVSGEGVDLRVLAGLRDAIDKFHDSLSSLDKFHDSSSLPFIPMFRLLSFRHSRFHDSLSSPLILNFSLRLAIDIRDRLQKICDFVYGVRKLVAQRYNTTVGGDPERVITVKPTKDYFLGNDLEILVKATMMLDEDDIQDMGLIDFDDYLPEPHEEIFEDGDEDEDTEAIEQGLYDLGLAWLHHTDSGLLWRTWRELDAIADGYGDFWPQLKEAEPCGFNQIDVVTDLSQIENV